MPDDIDRAQEAEAHFLELALGARSSDSSSGRHRPAPRPALAECEDCGEPIPEARRLAVAGCTRCVECQQKYERGR